MFVHYSMDDTFAEVTITQKGPSTSEQAIKLLARELTKTELNTPSELVRALSVLHWGVRKAAKYTAHHQAPIACVLRSPEMRTVVEDRACNVKIRSKVIDLLAYGVEFVTRENEWSFDG